MRIKMTNYKTKFQRKEGTPAWNSTYKKLAVQCLNETLCFVASSLVADNFLGARSKSHKFASDEERNPR